MKTELLDLSKNPDIEVTGSTMFVVDFSHLNTNTPYSLVVNLVKQNVKVEILGLYSLKKNESVKFNIIVNHKVPETSCCAKIKGILHDGTFSDFTGTTQINKDCPQTSSYLSHKVLLAGRNIKNFTQPILKIDSNNVKASHEATTGRIDGAELYYLCSRGLSEKEAEKLIIEGFFAKDLESIADQKILEIIKKQLFV